MKLEWCIETILNYEIMSFTAQFRKMAEDLGAEMEVDTIKEKRSFNETHSYACKVKSGGSCESCPNTPSKNQPPKRHKNIVDSSAKQTELSLNDVQENIIRILSEKINERSDQLERMVKENSSNIEALGKSLTSVHDDVMVLQKENEMLKNANALLEKKVKEMNTKSNDQERYSRRWCLRLYGLSEQTNENMKMRVMEVCKALVSDMDKRVVADGLDVAHRLGRLKTSDDGRRVKPRPVIVRFVSRTARDLIWKNSKNNEYLTTKGLRFKEDLTAFDIEARNCLWPTVERARKEGRNAYFSGARAFVDGKEIRPDEGNGTK